MYTISPITWLKKMTNNHRAPSIPRAFASLATQTRMQMFVTKRPTTRATRLNRPKLQALQPAAQPPHPATSSAGDVRERLPPIDEGTVLWNLSRLLAVGRPRSSVLASSAGLTKTTAKQIVSISPTAAPPRERSCVLRPRWPLNASRQRATMSPAPLYQADLPTAFGNGGGAAAEPEVDWSPAPKPASQPPKESLAVPPWLSTCVNGGVPVGRGGGDAGKGVGEMTEAVGGLTAVPLAPGEEAVEGRTAVGFRTVVGSVKAWWQSAFPQRTRVPAKLSGTARSVLHRGQMTRILRPLQSRAAENASGKVLAGNLVGWVKVELPVVAEWCPAIPPPGDFEP
jgi:hypothetical protein